MAFDDGVKTVIGSVAHTDDAAAKVPFVSVKCGIEPTLTGVSSVVETQTGKNLFDKSAVTANTWIIVNSTATEPTNSYSTSDYIPVKANTRYFVSSKDSNRSAYYDKNKNGIAYFSFNGNASFTALYDGFIRITIKNDIDLDTFIVNEGNTAITYEPYNGTTYTADLGRTIYGGTADIVNGEGTETHAKITDFSTLRANGTSSTGAYRYIIDVSGMGDYNVGACVSNLLAYRVSYNANVGEFYNTTNVLIIFLAQDNAQDAITYLQSNSCEIVYPLATPTDFTFTPITPTPETVGKVNNVYCNTGNTEVTYYDNAHGFSEVTVNRCGKNVWDEQWEVGAINVANGKNISNSNFIRSTNYIGVRPSTTYYKCAPQNILQLYYGKSKNYLSYGSWGKNGTFTTPSDCCYVRFYVAQEYGTTYNNDISINYPSTATSYEAYSGVSQTAYLHKVIYGGQADVVKGTCEPKNLLPMTNYDGGVYNPDVGRQLNLTVSQTQFEKTGGVYSVSTTSTWKTFTVLLPLISGVTYYEKWTLSAVDGQIGSSRAYLDEDFKVLARTPANSNPIVISQRMYPPSGAKYLAITWTNRGTAVQTLNITEPQIEKGTSASDYAQYFEPFSFPPISMSTDEGENTLFANEGDSAITYRKAVD